MVRKQGGVLTQAESVRPSQVHKGDQGVTRQSYSPGKYSRLIGLGFDSWGDKSRLFCTHVIDAKKDKVLLCVHRGYRVNIKKCGKHQHYNGKRLNWQYWRDGAFVQGVINSNKSE